MIASAQTADYTKPPMSDWPLVGGDWGNTRYSTLARINTSNVKTLKGLTGDTGILMALDKPFVLTLPASPSALGITSAGSETVLLFWF